MPKVYFIGAGPGDPDLLTIKGRTIIERADVIIYADSLVNPAICDLAREGAEIYGSAKLTLDEIVGLMIEAVRQGKTIARVHTGDPAIFGAIGEQMDRLDGAGIEYEVVPGVSSLFAATAALRTELTVPELSQTVIITRQAGRTPVPPAESLVSLAAHRASLAVFLSAALADRVAADLIEGGYPPETPAAVVYRASWPDEAVARTNLRELPDAVARLGIRKQAILLVGGFLAAEESGAASRLYDREFHHDYRPD